MLPVPKKEFNHVARIPNMEGRNAFLRLDKNECLDFDFADSLKDGLRRKLADADLSVYPEVGRLRNSIAAHYDLDENQIILGHGSDALIRQVFTVYGGQGTGVVTLHPTYAMYDIYTGTNGCVPRRIQCRGDFTFDPEAINAAIDGGVSILAIANPNSPTGMSLAPHDLLAILEVCEGAGVLMLLDEAYFYFSKNTLLPYISKSDNLVVIRTFSKALCLAGCRVGFLAANQSVVRELLKARPMYELNTLSCLAAEVALENEHKSLEYALVVEEAKAWLAGELARLEWRAFPSNTNFVNIRLPGGLNSAEFEDYAWSHGIIIKGRLAGDAFHNCVRSTVGPVKLMGRLVALAENFTQKYGNGK